MKVPGNRALWQSIMLDWVGCLTTAFHGYHYCKAACFQGYCGSGERRMKIKDVKTSQNLLFSLTISHFS